MSLAEPILAMASPPPPGSYHAAVLPTLFVAEPLVAGELQLDPAEAHHAVQVLRLAAGSELRVTDGAGRSGTGVVLEAGRRELRCRVEAVEELAQPASAALTVALAAPKGDRLEHVLRGLTELGVGAIAFLDCRRAQRSPREQRLRRVLVSALKQCGRSHLPHLLPACDIPTLAKTGGRLILCDAEGEPADIGPIEATTLVVGPEGGFTDAERDDLLGAGARRCRLAAHVLRIETAALAAAAVWAHAWELHERRG